MHVDQLSSGATHPLDPSLIYIVKQNVANYSGQVSKFDPLIHILVQLLTGVTSYLLQQGNHQLVATCLLHRFRYIRAVLCHVRYQFTINVLANRFCR